MRAAPQEFGVDEFPAHVLFQRTVNLLFPRKQLREASWKWLLGLRYWPAFEPESQIVISKRIDEGFIVTLYHLPSGSKNIGGQFTEIVSKSHSEDPSEIAKQIKVLVENVEVPSVQISRQLDRLAHVPVSPIEDLEFGVIHLDETRYEFFLWPDGGPVASYGYYDTETYGKPPRKHPRVVWMDEMKALVDRYAQQRAPAK